MLQCVLMVFLMLAFLLRILVLSEASLGYQFFSANFKFPNYQFYFQLDFFFFNRGSGTCIYFDKCCFAIQSSWTIVFTAFLYLLPPDNSLFS